MKILLGFFLSFSLLFGFEYNSIKSNFTQTITSPEGQKLTYTGNFYAKKPHYALWNYKQPVEKRVYFKNKSIMIVEPELEQVIISSLPQAPNISKLLKSAKKVKDNLYKAKYQDTAYNVWIVKNTPTKLSYKDKLDNHIIINFSNTVLNKELKNSIFEFNIPKDYDILKQ